MKKHNFLKKVVIFILVAIIAFTVAMIFLFNAHGAVPDALIYSFFGFCGGEAFFTSLIKRAANEEDDFHFDGDNAEIEYEQEDVV